jgi:hypothetical protein
VEARIVGLHDVDIIRVLLRKIIEKLLKIVGIHPIMLLNHTLTSQRFHRTIQIERFKKPLHLNDGFDFFQGNPAARDCL